MVLSTWGRLRGLGEGEREGERARGGERRR